MSNTLENQAKELHELVRQIGLSQRSIAERINVNQRQFRRYVAGKARVPEYVRLALKSLIFYAQHVKDLPAQG